MLGQITKNNKNKNIKKTRPPKVIDIDIIEKKRPKRKSAIKTNERNRKIMIRERKDYSSSIEESSESENLSIISELVEESYDDSDSSNEEPKQSPLCKRKLNFDMCVNSYESNDSSEELNNLKVSPLCKRKSKYNNFVNVKRFKKPSQMSFNTMGTCFSDSSSSDEGF